MIKELLLSGALIATPVVETSFSNFSQTTIERSQQSEQIPEFLKNHPVLSLDSHAFLPGEKKVDFAGGTIRFFYAGTVKLAEQSSVEQEIINQFTLYNSSIKEVLSTSFLNITNSALVSKFLAQLKQELKNSTQCTLITDQDYNLIPLGSNFCFIAHTKHAVDNYLFEYLENLVQNVYLNSTGFAKKKEIELLVAFIKQELFLSTSLISTNETGITFVESKLTTFLTNQFNVPVSDILMPPVSQIYNQIVTLNPNAKELYALNKNTIDERVITLLELVRGSIFEQMQQLPIQDVRKLLLYEYGKEFSYKRIISPGSLVFEVTKDETSIQQIGTNLIIQYNPTDPLEKFASDFTIEKVFTWLKNTISSLPQ
jgi:hypothetical protein